MTYQVQRSTPMMVMGKPYINPATGKPYEVKKWSTPNRVFAKRGGGYCEVGKIFVKRNGAYCQVWPTPVKTETTVVTHPLSIVSFFGGPKHAILGATATFTASVTVPYMDKLTANLAPTFTINNEGVVLFEYRAVGTTTWKTLGRTPLGAAGAASLQVAWPGPVGAQYEFRASYEPQAGTTPEFLPSVGPVSKPATIEAPGTGLTMQASIAFIDYRNKFIGSKITFAGSVAPPVSYLGPGPHEPAGARTGTVQVQWKLTSEPASKWTNFGSPHRVTSADGKFSFPLTIPKALTGDIVLRYIFHSSVSAIPDATSPERDGGIWTPGVGPQTLTKVSQTSTSVSFRWGAIRNADGYAIFSSAGDRETSIKRTTGRSSGNMRCVANKFTSFWVRAYATDRAGHRWYGPSGAAWDAYNGKWGKNRYQLHNLFEVQPKNP